MYLNRQNGTSLIEVLVTVLVLAVGLIGFAALQTQAMRINYESLQRSLASSMAEDLFDRMRANVNDIDNYVRNFNDDKPVINNDCAENVCSPSEMASWDLNNWMTRLADRLPNSDAQVTVNNRLVSIELRLVEQTGSQFAVDAAEAEIRNAETSAELEAAVEALNSIDIESLETSDFKFYTAL